MAGSLAFAPVLQWVPAEAAAGVLLYVGYLLLPKQSIGKGLAESAAFDISVAAVMGIISLTTFSLDKAMALGFWAYFAKGITTGGDKGQNAWLGGIAAVLSLTIIWQWWISPT